MCTVFWFTFCNINANSCTRSYSSHPFLCALDSSTNNIYQDMNTLKNHLFHRARPSIEIPPTWWVIAVNNGVTQNTTFVCQAVGDPRPVISMGRTLTNGPMSNFRITLLKPVGTPFEVGWMSLSSGGQTVEASTVLPTALWLFLKGDH